jgi:hypothetical protein
MYGFGGYWDDLTEVRGFDDFQWDSEGYVWAARRYDYCSAESYSTGWRSGYCYYRELVSSSKTQIGTTVEGSFWWLDPPGTTRYYQHSLFNRKVAKPDGSAYCGGWFSGSIVYGWHVACRVQQPPPCGLGVICFETDPW